MKYFLLLCVCACTLSNSSAFAAVPTVSKSVVCRAPPRLNTGLLTLHTFPLTGSHFVRMFLELYFDKPLLVRSFFHVCARAPDDYLLQHSMDAVAGNGLHSVFVRRNALHTVEANCRYAIAEREELHEQVDDEYKRACAIHYAESYGAFAAKSLRARAKSDEAPVLLDMEALGEGDLEHGELVFREIAQRRWPETANSTSFDAQRFREVAQRLSRAFVDDATKRVGVKVLPRDEQQASAFTDAYHSDISAAFLRQWRGAEDEACALFTELDCSAQVRAAAAAPRKPAGGESGSDQSDDAAAATPSVLAPNVHVLIPCKRPKNLPRCIKSLLTTADTNFGQIFLHFGIDWNDSETEKTIRSACSSLSANCTVHPVYSRAGDVSAIANHMFVTIEEDAYFFRFNDDTVMQTHNWNALAIRALRTAPTDIGLAVIHDHAHKIQTHSFVSALHRQIFGFYFPHHFKNWYEDNWITSAYVPALHKDTAVSIKHFSGENRGVRYKIESVPRDLLQHAIGTARSRVMRFMQRRNIPFSHSMTHDFSFERGV